MDEGTIGSAPSTSSWPGILNVFWQGTDQNLWYDYGG
jgi:hypothetical protein